MKRKKLKNIISLLIIIVTLVVLILYIEEIHNRYEENQLVIQECFDNYEGKDINLTIGKQGLLSVIVCNDTDEEQMGECSILKCYTFSLFLV